MRRARNTDPFTSWAAAMTGGSTDLAIRSLVLSALATFGPLTHDQLIELVRRVRPVSESGVRTRTRELVNAGWVRRFEDMTSKSRYGRTSLLWEFVPKDQR